ncbi:helix-turn-helix domain-containing protein [Kribbella deserti]|uniref:Helix-turn-helix domain-containing protein n=1 Tax=Kribbella deserti TaxID=1926257 RepID=A0ABV6QXI8_9ACTN
MNNQLGEFLKARRAAVTPDQVDLPRTGVRRVPGLRREEVASLAGLSVDYYARLEQGREQHPSPSVLSALARVLNLNPDAQRYLFGVAGASAPIARGQRKISPNLVALINDWPAHPVVVADSCHNIVATNQLGAALYGGHQHSDNIARLIFLDPDGPTLFRNWDRSAASCAASMRALAGQNPNHAELMALVGELTVRSEVFAGLWAKAEVLDKASEFLHLHHPVVGDLDLHYEALRPNGSPDLLVKVYRSPNAEMTEKLAMLGSLTAATPAPVEADEVPIREES